MKGLTEVTMTSGAKILRLRIFVSRYDESTATSPEAPFLHNHMHMSWLFTYTYDPLLNTNSLLPSLSVQTDHNLSGEDEPERDLIVVPSTPNVVVILSPLLSSRKASSPPSSLLLSLPSAPPTYSFSL